MRRVGPATPWGGWVAIGVFLLGPAPSAESTQPLPAGPDEAGEVVSLGDEPELQASVSGRFPAPTASELVAALRAQTGVPLALDRSVIHDRPIQGATEFRDVPLETVMAELAENQYVRGQWRKIRGEYRLYATYTGPSPDPLVLIPAAGEPATPDQFGEPSARIPALVAGLFSVLVVGGFILWRLCIPIAARRTRP